MRGRVSDVLGVIPVRNTPVDNPMNIYLFNALYVKPEIAYPQVNNVKARLAQRRTIPLMVVSRPQPATVTIIPRDEKKFSPGGIAVIPNAGIWQGVLGRG